MHSQFVGSQYAGYHSIILEIDRQIRFFFHSNSFVFQPSLSPEKTLNKNKKSPMSSLTNLNKWSNYRLNFHRKTYHVTQIFSTQKKNEKKVWIKKPELTMNKIVSQTKRNAFSKINTRSWYWFQCSFPSIARQGGQLDTQDKIVWPRSDDKHLKYASFCSDFYGWVIFSQNTNH